MLMFKRLPSHVTALAVGFALVLIVIAGNIWFNVSQRKGSELVQHTMEVQSQLYRLLSFLEDAETGQRGYLLTGDEGFLAPYVSATAALDGQLKNLAALIADPGQRQALSTLTNLTKERLARLKEIIDRYRVGERDRALAMVRSGASKVAMDQARASIAEMVADEAHLLEFRQRDVERTTRWLFAGMVLVIILVIALALMRSPTNVAERSGWPHRETPWRWRTKSWCRRPFSAALWSSSSAKARKWKQLGNSPVASRTISTTCSRS